MIERLSSLHRTILFPWDFSKVKKNKKLKLGWCGHFPPSKNGASVVSEYFVKEISKDKSIDVFAIPFGNRIDKRRFRGIKFARLEDLLDVVVFYCLGEQLLPLIGKTRAKKIIYQTFHDENHLTVNMAWLLKLFEECDLAVAACEWAKKALEKKMSKKAICIPHAVDVSEFLPSKKPRGKFRVLFLNRLHFFKGVFSFLDAVPLVLSKNKKIEFVMHAPTDKNSPHLQEMLEIIKKLSLKFPKNFSFKSQWSDSKHIMRLYRDSNVLVFPSNNEGFGMPLAEAMSCGIPCITSKRKPMDEIVVDGKTGYCLALEKKYLDTAFPAPEKIAEKILLLEKDSVLYKRLCKNSRKRAVKEYSLKKSARQMIQAAKNLAKQKKGS